jgi:hypothetical protein
LERKLSGERKRIAVEEHAASCARQRSRLANALKSAKAGKK